MILVLGRGAAAVAEEPAESAVLRFSAPPETAAEVQEWIARVDEELRALAPTTRPAATQPTTAPGEDVRARLDAARQSLWEGLGELRSRLAALEEHLRVIAAAENPAEVGKLTAEMETWKSRAGTLRRAPLPEWPDDKTVAEAEKEYETHNQLVDGLTASLQKQEAMLGTGFKKRRDELAARIAEARAEREKLDASFEVNLKAADSDAARELVQVARRAAAARVAALLTARAAIDHEERRTELESQRTRLKRDAVRPYVVALRRRMNALKEEKSRSHAERLERRLASDDLLPHERAYFRMELLKERTIARLQREYANAVRDRFPASALQELTTQVDRDQTWWARFADSISRRAPRDVFEAWRTAGRELDDARARLARLQVLLDASVNEQRLLEEWQIACLEELRGLEQEFRRAGAATTHPAAGELSLRLGPIRLDVDKEFESLLSLEKETITRLAAAIEGIEAHVALWEGAQSRLYWSYLVTRGPGCFDPQGFTALRTEAAALVQHDLPAALTTLRHEFLAQFSGVTRADWFGAGTSAVLILAAGLWARRRCVVLAPPATAAPTPPSAKAGEGGADAATRPSESPAAAVGPQPFVHRLRRETALVGRWATLALALLAALSTVALLIDLRGVAADVWRVVQRAALIVIVVEASVEMLFRNTPPALRLVPFGRAVARHYRRSVRAILLLGIALLLPMALLRALTIEPAIQEALRAVFQFLATGVVLLFLLRRETVLNIFPRAERGPFTRSAAILRRLYPLLLLLTAALVVMQPVGYRALAAFISNGLITALAAMVGASLAYSLAVDLMVAEVRRWRRATGRPGPQAPPPDPSAARRPTQDMGKPASEPQPPTPDSPPPIDDLPTAARVILGLLRAGLAVGVAVMSLAAWGVGPYEVKRLLDLELWEQSGRSVTFWRIGASVLAVVVAVILSRVVRETLRARFYPRQPGIDRSAAATINVLLHYVLMTLGLYVGLQMLHIDLGALVLLLGGLGLGIGLGLQPMVVNFISGLILLLERQVKVGDVVVVHGQLGEVTSVSMRSTIIRTPDGIHLIVPNGEIINQQVENWTLNRQPIRGMVDVGVAYESDSVRVRELLMSIARVEPLVLRDPPPDVFFVEFGPSSLNFRLACWFRDPKDRWFGMIALRHAISRRFREEGVKIPFPQTELTFGPAPLDVRMPDGLPDPFAARARVGDDPPPGGPP